MSYPCNVNKIAEYVKSIVEANRCSFCDKLEGTRWRFNCGHAACVECVGGSSCCRLCLTPPLSSEAHLPALDEPLTARAAAALTLLQTCQETFHIDVYKRLRISEQIKAERELFPSCIQAPTKYFNKRKSYGHLRDKENISLLPGEVVPSAMDKNNYVQRWLEQSILSPRKAFTDLNVNQADLVRRTPIKRRVDLIMDNVSHNTENIPIKKSYKVNKQTSHNKHLKITENKRKQSGTRKKNALSCKDESGIVVDETIVIDESLTQEHVDKDHQAWLAVQRAHVDSASSRSEHEEEKEVVMKNVNIKPSLDLEPSLPHVNLNIGNINTTNKVPFYKKTNLKRPRESTVESTEIHNSENNVKPITSASRDVSITIESDTFVTMIKVSNVPEKGTKQSVGVQTDLQALQEHNNEAKVVESQDMFGEAIKRQNQGVFIEDSDSGSEDSGHVSRRLEVAAQVHQPAVDGNVLGQLDPSDNVTRARRGPRGPTPTSTDSSDKENYDPNRHKQKYAKKHKKNNKPNGFL